MRWKRLALISRRTNIAFYRSPTRRRPWPRRCAIVWTERRFESRSRLRNRRTRDNFRAIGLAANANYAMHSLVKEKPDWRIHESEFRNTAARRFRGGHFSVPACRGQARARRPAALGAQWHRCPTIPGGGRQIFGSKRIPDAGGDLLRFAIARHGRPAIPGMAARSTRPAL